MTGLYRARVCMFCAAILYGSDYSLLKILDESIPVSVSSPLRFGLATLATLPWLLKDYKKPTASAAAWFGFEIGIWNSIGCISQAVALDSIPASEVAFIYSLAVVFVPLLDCTTGKKILRRQIIAAFLAVVGVALLEFQNLPTMSTGALILYDHLQFGVMMALIQPFAFGIGLWRTERSMQRFPNEARRMTAAQLLAIFLSSLVYCFWINDISTLRSLPWKNWLQSPPLLLNLIWTGIITTILAIFLENLGMKVLSATETILILSTEPLWGTAFAAVFSGERLGRSSAIGATLILIACIYSNLDMDGVGGLFKGSNKCESATVQSLDHRDRAAKRRKRHRRFSRWLRKLNFSNGTMKWNAWWLSGNSHHGASACKLPRFVS